MDCADAQTCFPLLTLPVGELTGELLAAQQHLEHCAVCRTALQHAAAGDQKLSRLMSAVRMPEGFSQRLREQVTAHQAKHFVARPAKLNRRPWIWGSVAALVIFAVIAPWVIHSMAPASITLDQMLTAILQPEDSSGWTLATKSDLPMGWLQGSQLSTQPYRVKSLSSVMLYAAKFQFAPPRGSGPVVGTLWMADLHDISDSGTIPGLESAQIQYVSEQGLLIWKENSTLYIVTLDERPLHQLLKLLRSRSMA